MVVGQEDYAYFNSFYTIIAWYCHGNGLLKKSLAVFWERKTFTLFCSFLLFGAQASAAMSLQASNPSPAKSSGGQRRVGQGKGILKVTKTIKGPRTGIKLSPSTYLANMKMKTEEKLELTREMYSPKIIELLDITTTSHYKDSHLNIDQAFFQPFPSEVVFQQFEPHLVYEFPLRLRNLDRVARHIKVASEESPYFNIACQKSSGAKIAPGMEIMYNVIFKPEEKKDYEHELVCITEREKFVIPVRAIGARALLDFPDDIRFNSAPVKYRSTKTILMRNIGDADAKFTIEAEKPYSVSPSNGTLDIGSCMQVDVFYIPKEVGDHSRELMIHYSTGETIYTRLYGCAKDVNVYLDRTSVVMDDTFFGLSSQRSILLHNRSDVVVKFQLKAYSNEMEEDEHREKLLLQYQKEEKLSKEAFFQSCVHNPTIRDRLPILARTLDLNKKKYTDEERFLYFDEVLVIDPLEGEIWPNSQAEISIFFRPDAFANFSRIAYCDVIGRETRLPLKIKGDGIGPKCIFSFDTLDIQNVFINSSHAYELILKNIGSIEGSYSLTPPSSLFGPKFTFAPSSGTLQPDSLQAIQISFCSRELGEFDEEFQWVIQGGKHPLLLRIKGMVIGPTFQFDTAYIKFGHISCGFTASKEVLLSNTSEIPMTFHLRLREAVKLMSTTTTEQQEQEQQEQQQQQQQPSAGLQLGPPPSTPPKEFVVLPQTGTLPPKFQQPIQVNLTPTSMKTYSTALILELQETNGEVFSLPISAKAVTPHISTVTPLLNFQRCFLDHPYTLDAELVNDSDFMVQYEVMNQTEQTTISYYTAVPNGVIQPHSILRIPLQIKARKTGKLSACVPVRILHSSEPPANIQVKCIGEGPVVFVRPDSLNWGTIPVLTSLSKTVTLSNHSLIPADFECVLANERTVFSVNPPSAQLQPNQSLDLAVTAFIDDHIMISDKLTIIVFRGINFTISLRAEGKGTTIVSDPPLQPSINLGTYFSHGTCENKFTLTNRGRRSHAMSWSTEGFSASKMRRAEMHRKSQDPQDIKVKRLSVIQEKGQDVIKKPVFQMVPNKAVLEPLQSCSVKLLGSVDKPQRVMERMVCHAIIGKNPYEERIMTVDIMAKFISPLLEFTSQEVLFSLQQPPGSKLIYHTQELGVRNIGRLPVTARFLVSYPFCLMSNDVAMAQLDLKLGAHEESEITILYDSTYCKDKRSRVEETFMTVAYREHPQKDQILLKAEIDFPNLVFNKDEIDFGCVLNDVEVMKLATMTNSSPLPVQYSWYFINRPPVVRGKDAEQLDEGVDMESEYDSPEEVPCGRKNEEEEEGEEEEEEEDGEEEKGSNQKGEEVKEEEKVVVERGECSEVSESSVSCKANIHIKISESTSMVGPNGGHTVAAGHMEQAEQEDIVIESGIPLTDSQLMLQDSKTAPRTMPNDIKKKKLTKRKKKKAIEPWRLAKDPFTPIPITQVFDILPLHGLIAPGDTQPVEFMFFGHADITADVTAACKIEGGPTYEIRLCGEASQIRYKFSDKKLDLGIVMYDQVHTTQFVLQNRGKVCFDFSALNLKEVGHEEDHVWQSGEVMVSPRSGRLEALDSVTFTVSFFPGMPEEFSQPIEFQVAHFQVDVIMLTGKAVYPKMALNLPRDLTTVTSDILEEANSNIDHAQQPDMNFLDSEAYTHVLSTQKILEDEVERLLVKSFSAENASKVFGRKSKPRVSFPQFCLDFGYLEYGTIKSHHLSIINTGHTPISFTSGCGALRGSGFTCNIPERVRALPPGEKLEFSITFDPASIQLMEGKALVILPFNLVGGPRYSVKLMGVATRPKMEVSSTELDFGTVICGQCRIITIRLSNPYHVNCEWKAVIDKPFKQLPKYIPQHLRKKMKEKPPPKYFEVKPSSGVLPPGETKNIWVRFIPSEEKSYSDVIPFIIRQNPDCQLVLSVTGVGSEPEIVFSSSMLQFGPILPFSVGMTQEVTVSNPTPYPVEFYSLEFDSQYIEEEEIVSWLKDYYVLEKHLLLPPFQPDAILPQEVLDAYQKAKDMMKFKSAEHDSLLPSEVNIIDASSYPSVDQLAENPQLKVFSADPVGTYESKSVPSSATRSIDSSVSSLNRITEVTGFTIPTVRTIDGFSVEEALARHVGVDITLEGKEAEKRRGVTMIMHGPALSGRTTQAKAIASYYGGVVLDIDTVLIEAMSSATTEAAIKARTQCYQAMKAKAENGTETTATLGPKKQFSVIKEKDKEKDQPQTDPVSYLRPSSVFKVDPHMDMLYAVPEGTLMPIILQEDYIVDILANRFAQPDCLKAVVVDGIDSSFSALSMPMILRAFNNRTHIYVVHLEIGDLHVIKERQEELDRQKLMRIKEEEERKKEAEEREEQRILALLDMEEDEYEALTEEQRDSIDAIRLKRKKLQRLKKQKEREEKLRVERERKEEEERLREEEKKKKGKKEKKPLLKTLPTSIHGLTTVTSRSGSVASAAGIVTVPSPMQAGLPGSHSGASLTSGHDSPNNIPASVSTPKHTKIKRKASPKPVVQMDADVESCVSWEKSFINYKLGIEGLKAVLDDWDRQKGITRYKKESEEPKTTPIRKGKGRIKEHETVHEVIPENEETREGLGVPLIDIDGNQQESVIREKILASGLPTLEEILIGLGLGPSGTPIPNPVTLQVCPYPLKRAPVKQESDMFCFIAASPDDPNGPLKTAIGDLAVPELMEEKKVPTGSRQSRRAAVTATTTLARPDSDSGNSRKSSLLRKKNVARSDRNQSSPHPPSLTSMPETPDSFEKKDENIKLVKFRWSIPPMDEVKLKLHFKSQDLGHFDFTFNFEIVGTKRRYQLFCRGMCDVPQICWEPKTVFPRTKGEADANEILQKVFVEKEKMYHFGPLHCGKTRERYKECRYPQNVESLTIKNISFVDLEVSFYFLNDSNASTFLLDPLDMSLKKGESKTLNIWAYPKTVAKVEDALVFCVKNNPNPIHFRICTHGAEPEIKLDRKIIEFKRVLLHRKQTSVLRMLNKTLLPVAWKLGGLEQLGDEFSFSQDHGIIQPLTEFPLGINFRASRPVNYPKKNFKIEVSDVQQIMGLMHVESVQIVAESYDVAIDVSFPRGTDGGLDFQCVKVCEEVKLMLQIKNKGKYDVAYNIQCENSVGPEGINCSKLFHIQPATNPLYPSDKPQTVSITFKPDKEVEFQNVGILKIQVIDIHLGEQGEVIANIPIRVRAKAAYSHYTICPRDDINFGSMIINSRKQSCFTIHNRGMFDFKYSVNKQLTEEQQKQRAVNMAAAAAKIRVKSRERVTSAKSKTVLKNKNDVPQRTEVLTGTQKLVLGMYAISPAYGTIVPGQTQTITVDCIADKAGPNHENLSIEISDQQRDTPPVSYRICGDVLVPGIEMTDMATIFEEHRVCKRLGALGQHLFHEGVGVYGEEEKKFIFKSVVVGKTSMAQFKITNPNKIQCEVSVIARIPSSRSKSTTDNVFEVVEPSSKVTISPHSSIYAKVLFRPTAMQIYSANFEAITDFSKSKGLMFELQGEGNLPQVTVVHPTLRNSKGIVCMLFQQLSLQNSQALPLTLRNTGTIPSQVTLEVTGGSEAFQVCSPSGEIATPDENVPASPTCFMLEVGESCECMVHFTPQAVKKYRGELRLSVMDNIFERQHVQLIGEGYKDNIFISNIRGMVDDRLPEIEEIPDSEDIEASRITEIYFGITAVGETKRIMFSLSNLCNTSTLRFQWMSIPSLTFMPSTGHIKPNSSKDITVAFTFNKPHSLKLQKVVGRMCRINFSMPLSEVPDWDDSMKSVHWVNVPQPILPTNPTSLDDMSYNSIPPSIVTTSVSVASRQVLTPPAKKKVVEVEKEPPHVVMEDTNRDIELFVTGLTDYVKYECPLKRITFKDTLMYQTRVYTFPLKNTGNMYLEYEWLILNEDGSTPSRPPSQLLLDDRGSVISEGGEVIPFSVDPTSGTIPPDSETQVTVRFSPLDVMAVSYLLRCHILHLDMSCSPLELPVTGSSLMPFCHFELEKSDYLDERAAKADSSVVAAAGQGVDRASIRVVEFVVCGLGVLSTRKFNVINPTDSNYEFVWSEENTGVTQPFRCYTRQGVVQAGKKYQMVFEYMSGSLEVVESIWTFTIPSIGLSNTFLLVGQTIESSVNFDRAYLSFKAPLLLGAPAKQTVYIINNELTPYQFSIVDKSLHAEGFTGHLRVSPTEGTVPANSKLPLEIRFTPQHQKDYSFSLKCKVKRKMTLLSMKVKAEGYGIELGLSHSSPGGSEVELPVGQLDPRVLDLGQVQINENRVEYISLFNHSLYSLEYSWTISHKKRHVNTFTITPQTAEVASGNKQVCQLLFLPTTKMIIKNCQLILEVVNGPKLPITLEGSAVEPALHFSFLEYNFGPCILYKTTENPIPRSTLVITNKGDKELTVHCLYESRPHLDVRFKSSVLAPMSKTEAIIEFKPQKVAKHCEEITFEINGCFHKVVTIKGEGAKMRIELANPAQRTVNLGALQIGSTDKTSSSRTIKIVNQSPSDLSPTLSFAPSSSVPALQQDGVITIEPAGEILLRANGGLCNIIVTFKPRSRVPRFSEPVKLECLGFSEPLFVLTGSCQGLEVSLDTDHIPFGAVVQDSFSSRKICMMNTGDIGASFSWNTEAFGPEFSVSPKEGFISSGKQITTIVNFHPKELQQDVRKTGLKCNVEGLREPLKLNLSGICIEKVPFKDILQFVTHVRSKETRHLTIHNKTHMESTIHPVLDGEYWSGPDILTIGPNQSRHYELTYHPLEMTSETHRHTGSAFFPQPDGTGILYHLQGISEPPKQVAQISQEVPCKTPHTELLSVENWLARPQRFVVKRDILKPERVDHTTSLDGLDYIDVPAMGKKDYQLHFNSFKECTIIGKVTFKNEETGEFLFYGFHLKATAPGILSSFDLTTPVRQSISQFVKIINPFNLPATMSASCTVPEITIPASFILGASSSGGCMFEYLPLKVGETVGKLVFQCSELGMYQYELRLTATPGPHERPVHFTASLGSSQQQVCKFTNYAKGRTEYICKLTDPDFSVDKSITAAGSEASIDVTFEPSYQGDSQTLMQVTSNTGGDYTIPLFGHCLPPKPQGPFAIRSGHSINIPFKNIYHQFTQFRFIVDNPVFVLSKSADMLKPRKNYNILVTYDGKNADGLRVGKLIVSVVHGKVKSAGKTSGQGEISWVYYLKGMG